MALVLGSSYGDKPSLLIRAAGKEIQGGGGGQPAYATAGGKNVEGVARAIEVAVAEIMA